MISYNEVKRFLEEQKFVKVTDFAKTIKPQHKNKKKKKEK